MALFGPPNIDKLKAKHKVKNLTKALAYKKDPTIRKEAAQALGQIGDVRAVSSLVTVIKTDKVSWVCKASIEALEKLGWQPNTDEAGAFYWILKEQWDRCSKIGTPAVMPLISALEDGVSKAAAVKALGQIGDVRAVEPLIAAFKNKSVTESAIDTLVKIGTPTVEPLIAALRDENWYTRWAAAKTLGQIGDTRAIEPLIAALQDKDASVCGTVVTALHRIGWEPEGDAEKAAYWITKGKLNKLSELNYQTIKEILIKGLNWDLDWQINGQIAVLLVQHDMSVSDPRLQQTIQELKAWASKLD